MLCYLILCLLALSCQGSELSQWAKEVRRGRREKLLLKTLPDSVLLTRQNALNFYKKQHGRFRRNLYEECYGEGCGYEEVDESLGGEDLYQYYYSYKCRQQYGGAWTWSGNHAAQCSNSLLNVQVCSTSYVGMGIGSRRWCSFGGYKAVWAFYMEAGCNDGEQGSFKIMFNDAALTTRYVYNLGCRERKTFTTVYGATSLTIEMIGGGGGDNYVSTSSIGWFGWNLHYCGNPGSPANGYKSGNNYVEGSVVNFHCNSGYTLSGTSSVRCYSSGWSAGLPACKRHCRPGTYSSQGHEPCSSCPIGKYQPNWNSRSCYSCPSGKTTTGTGKTHISQCHYQCSYVDCNVLSWSSWTDSSTPQSGHCASQERTRGYSETWHDVIKEEGCHQLPQSCPAPQKQYREKVITCPPLSPLEYGTYQPAADCLHKHMACGSSCTAACNQGFHRQGQSSDAVRVCQANGQWSSLKTYCKDVTPPSLTCPDKVEVGNDPGKNFASVHVPQPKVLSDNTGVVPTLQVSPSDLTEVHPFTVRKDPHKIKYIAKDEAGLMADCEFEVKVKDVEPPEVVFCPQDIRWQSSKSPDRVVWDRPVFKDNNDTQLDINSQGRQPGTEMYWGVTEIIYTATDASNHTATCKFKVDMGPNHCTVYDAPNNGARSCTIKVQNITQEFACLVQCKEGYTLPESSYTAFHCSSNGVWHAMVGSQLIRLPEGRPWEDCSKASSPTEVSTNVVVFAGSCNPSDSSNFESIKENFLKYIYSNYFTKVMICMRSGETECVLQNFKVSCGLTTRRRRRRGITTENEYKISFDFDLNNVNPSTDDAVERAKIASMIQEMTQFLPQFSAEVKLAASSVVKAEGGVVVEEDVLVEESPVKPKCLEGKVLKRIGDDYECVNCPTGTFYNGDLMKCMRCGGGTYQDQEGQMYCKPCPAGTWTTGDHSKNFTECRRICGPGEYSSDGLETCLSCPVGSYQTSNRSTECLKCPAGTSTASTRARSADDCKKECVPGEYSTNGLALCLPCPKGQYQALPKSTSCTQCPDGKTTSSEGAKSAQECT